MKFLRIGPVIVVVCMLFCWFVPNRILAYNMQSNSAQVNGEETTFVFMLNDAVVPNRGIVTISEFTDYDFMIEMQAAIYVKNVSEGASKLSLSCIGKENFKEIEFCPNGYCMAWPADGNELTMNYKDAILSNSTVEQGNNWLHALAFDTKSFRGSVELKAYNTINPDDCATITVIFDTEASSSTSFPIATGSCGDNVTYTIFSDMTMVISGIGTIKDFSTDSDYFESIKKVIIEDGVTSIGDYAFAYCDGLTSITMPNSVTSIGDYAFAYCDGLTSITMPNSLTTIGNHAFHYCDGLTSITMPNSLTTIGAYAFADCSGLSSVTKGDNIFLIGFRAFYNTLWLDNQPDGIVYVGKVAYYFKGEMPKGEDIILKDGTLGISFGIFCDSGSPTFITIPSSLISVEPFLCYYIDYHYEGTNIFGNVDFIKVDENNLLYDSRDNCNAIIEKSSNRLIAGSKNTVIPHGVTNIGPFTLGYMTSVTIPSSVTLIDGDAFYYHVFYVDGDASQYRQRAMAGYSSALKSIIMEGSTPPDITIDDRDDLFDYCVLYVPIGSKSVYESAKGWCAFQNIIEYEPDTDISSLDNAIYVDYTEGRIGGTMDIPVKLKNSYPVRGFIFTMEFPEGTIVNSWKLSTNRLPEGATVSDKFSTQKIEGNKINVACSLNYGEATFTGNDGEIATVNVSFANDMEVGEYPIYLTACDVSDAGGTDNKLSDIKATLVLEDYIEGDANGDGVVLIGDVIAILNYIVGVTSNNFNEKAADVNGDGEILIGDVIAVLNIIVSQ